MRMQKLLQKDELLLCVAIFTLGICIWGLLAGYHLSISGILVTALFFLGVMAWSGYSQLLFPSEATNASYIPLGFSINSCITLALVFIRLGTIYSGGVASALGFALYLGALHCKASKNSTLKLGLPSNNERNTSKSLHIALASVSVATLISYKQLVSATTLGLTDTNTLIEGWSDLVLHAVTVLQLSSLHFTEAPLSPFNATSLIPPYHYGAYAFPALLTSSSKEISPLVAYISCGLPIGITLLLCPVFDRSGIFKSFRSFSSNILYFISALLVYVLWCKLLSQSFLDPVWLLITGPSVIYASSLIVSFFNILSLGRADSYPISQVLLSIIFFIQICAFKLQVAHSLLLVFAYIALERLLVSKGASGKVSRFFILSLTIISLSLSQLALYQLLNVSRASYFKDLISFLSSVVNMTSITASGPLPRDNPIFLVLISVICGSILLLGPLFATSVLVSLRRGVDGMAGRLENRLIILSLLSYAFAILLNPVAPWDSTEFQNRSWPILWCIGLWYLSAVSTLIPKYLSPKVLRFAILLLIVIIVNLLPPRKVIFIGSPLFSNDWSKNYYPLSISPQDKQLALEIKQHAIRSNSFIYIPNGSEALLNDQVSIVSSLSGISPLFSRQEMQSSISRLGDSTHLESSKDDVYRISEKVSSACATLTGSGRIVSISIDSLPTRRNSMVFAACND